MNNKSPNYIAIFLRTVGELLSFISKTNKNCFQKFGSREQYAFSMVLLRKTESYNAEWTKYRRQKAEKLKRQKLVESKKECEEPSPIDFLSFRKQLVPLRARKGAILSYIFSNCKKIAFIIIWSSKFCMEKSSIL